MLHQSLLTGQLSVVILYICFEIRTHISRCHLVRCSVVRAISVHFLNQARAVRRPARAWFLKIDLVRIVGMRGACVRVCVCPRPKLLITSGVMWRDMDLIQLVKQVLQLLYGNCSRYC